MTAPKSDLPQGTLDLLILKVLALGPLHGYADRAAPATDLARGRPGHARDAVSGPAPAGEPRVSAAEWKMSDTGREAKFYRLTRAGRAHMDREHASWERLTRRDRRDPEDRRRRRRRELVHVATAAISVDERLDAELRDHVERHVADYVAHGMSEADARRQVSAGAGRTGSGEGGMSRRAAAVAGSTSSSATCALGFRALAPRSALRRLGHGHSRARHRHQRDDVQRAQCGGVAAASVRPSGRTGEAQHAPDRAGPVGWHVDGQLPRLARAEPTRSRP